MNTKEILFSLTSFNGSSGDEYEIAEEITKLLPSSYTDRLGNVLADFNPSGKIRIMLEAHIDRIGFIVTEIEEGGFLRLAKCGGIDIRTAVGAAVTVFGTEPLFGVICSTPPHLQKNGDGNKKLSVDDLAVDIGMSREEAEKHVRIGDRVLLNDEKISLLNGNITASSLDDRAGVAAVIIAAVRLKDRLKNVNLLVALNTREEVGGQGAAASAFRLEPDIAVCVDTGFGIDHYTSGAGTIALGKGPSIGIAPVLDRKLTDKFIALAKDNGISYQHDVMSSRTGTDADTISNSRCGVKTALLSIPLRSMHTQAETASIDDIELTAELIERFVLGEEGVETRGNAPDRLDLKRDSEPVIERTFNSELSTFGTLQELCSLDGTSGSEEAVREYIISKIDGKCEYSVDPMGNIIAFKKGKKAAKNKVLLTAHMDEVGLIVTEITESGFLKFETVGGIDSKVLCGRAVRFTHNQNPVKGVIGVKPVHLCEGDEDKTAPATDSLAIDIGAKDKADAEKYVSVGDCAYFISPFIQFGDGRICSKAIDDRFGCAELIAMIERENEYDLNLAFLVQEEVGLRGAGAAAFAVRPDYAVVLEATTASDIVGVSGSGQVCAIGGGAVVSFMDRTTVYDRRLFSGAFETAKKKSIMIQPKTATTGGNDAGAIHKAVGGVKTITISLPCRYIHSGTSVASKEDMKACFDLAVALSEEYADA